MVIFHSYVSLPEGNHDRKFELYMWHMRICYTSVHAWAMLRVNFGIQVHYTIQYQWSI